MTIRKNIWIIKSKWLKIEQFNQKKWTTYLIKGKKLTAKHKEHLKAHMDGSKWSKWIEPKEEDNKTQFQLVEIQDKKKN